MDAPDKLSNRLLLAMTGSCTCLTKTHVMEWHRATCRYRLFMECLPLVLKAEEE